MKKRILQINAIGLLLLLVFLVTFNRGFFSFSKQTPIHDLIGPRTNEPVLDIYADDDRFPALVHFATTLNGSSDWSLSPEQIASIPQNKDILLTIEMWGSEYYQKKNYASLREISQGKHDQKIKTLGEQVLKGRQNVYVRWNPEMEVPVDRFPWQNNPVDYIAAFRHFSALVKTIAPEAKIVWGPAAYPGVLEFWPGAEYVDWVSISLNGETELMANAYPREDAVPVLLKRKLHRLRFIDKPVLILGSEQVPHEAYQSSWLSDYRQLVARETDVYGVPIREKQASGTPKPVFSTPQLGLYDPNLLLTDQEAISVEHLFVDFENLADGRFQKAFAGVVSRGHDVIVTVEPMERQEEEVDREVLDHVIAGQYDSVFQKIYGIIGNVGQRVYLRFAHEMEIPITRYPWQSQDPVVYIRAFRHFMSLQDDSVHNILRVWGPAGDRGSLEWWPGNDVVDLISVAIYGLPDKNITDPNEQEAFRQIFRRKYYRMRFVDKPVFITEFGVKGPEKLQRNWLADAARTINENPRIVGINYFNMVDNPEVWGDIDAPDWSINQGSLAEFVRLLDLDRNTQ